MKVTSTNLYIFCVYWIFAIYFCFLNIQSFLVYIFFSALLFLVFFVSLKKKFLVFNIFCIFFFLSNVVSPSFFLINKGSYTYSGWTAVKNFNFTLMGLLEVYQWLFLALFFIFFFFYLLNFFFPNRVKGESRGGGKSIEHLLDFSKNQESPSRSGLKLVAFIILIAIPLSIIMAKMNVGIVGVPQTRLPFRLTGMLYYFRFFIVPVIIFYYYFKSSRSFFYDLLIILYAVVASLSSVSRSILIISFMSVLIFSFLEKKYIRLTFSLLVLFACYHMTGIARNYVYVDKPIEYIELWSGLNKDYMFDIVGQIGTRLGGAQDQVLAYQYKMHSSVSNIVKFFTFRPLTSNDAYEIYGFNLPSDMAFGVGLSAISWIIIVTNKSLVLLTCVSFIVSLMLFATEKVVSKILLINNVLSIAAYPISFFMVFLFYTNQFKYFYVILFVMIFLLILKKFLKDLCDSKDF